MSYYGSYGYGSSMDQFMAELSTMDLQQLLTAYLGIVLAVLAVGVLFMVARARIFHKAGLPWERTFVPVYGEYWDFKLAGCSWMFWANIIVPVVAVALVFLLGASAGAEDIVPLIFAVLALCLFIFNCIYCVKLSKSFGHGAGFGIGLLLLFPIFFLILGLGGSQYTGEYK